MNAMFRRYCVPLTAGFLIATTHPLFAECAVENYDVPPESSISVPLSPTLAVQLTSEGEIIQLDVRKDNKVTHQGKFETFWGHEHDSYILQILAIDVNNDGIRELLIGEGHTTVNTYYAMLIFRANGTLQEYISVSDPDFCKTDTGFSTWYRSGPRGTDIYWAINASGIPYQQIIQTVVDDVVSHRVVYAEDGTMTAQSIVANELDILATSPPFAAVVATTDESESEGAIVYDHKDRLHAITRIQAGTPLVLFGSDDTYSVFLVEYKAGKRGWITSGDVSYNQRQIASEKEHI